MMQRQHNSMLKVCFLLTLMTLLVVPSLVLAAGNGEERGLVKVTVLLFSGRPNPVFYLEEQPQVDKLKGFLAKKNVEKSFQDTVLPSRLGYAGLIVENVKGVAGLPEKLAIFDNKMEFVTGVLTKSETKQFFTDGSGSIETFLLDLAVTKNAMNQELRNFVKNETNK